jgi:hypothetical protein
MRSLLALVLCTLLSADALAGIVILDTGRYLVGEVSDESQHLVVRWPYGDVTHREELRLDLSRVRWFSTTADLPTEAYFEEHPEAALDPRLEPLRQRWQRLREVDVRLPPPADGLWPIPADEPRPRLAQQPLEGSGFRFRPPERWRVEVSPSGRFTVTSPDGITHIEVWSEPSGADPLEVQADLTRDVLVFTVSLNEVSGGHDLRVVVGDRETGQTISHTVSFRAGRVCFFRATSGHDGIAADSQTACVLWLSRASLRLEDDE